MSTSTPRSAEAPAPRNVHQTVHQNTALRALLAESDWTQEALARALTRLGAESGMRLRYDRTSIAHWLRGSRPRPAVQQLLAEAFSRRLGRRVTVPELGMGGSEPPGATRRLTPVDHLRPLTAPLVGPAPTGSPQPAPYRLDRLRPLTAPRPAHPPGRSPRGTSGPPSEGSGRADAPPSAPRSPHRRSPRAPVPSSRGGRAPGAGPAEVASVRAQARFFTQQVERYGGGTVRVPLAASLEGLGRSLRNGQGPYREPLLAGAARLSYLLARVYADEERQGLAQSAFLTASELAAAGEDADLVALSHRALSSQAHQLGHHRQALALAESACRAAPESATGCERAFLYAGLAVAQASTRQAVAARRSLERAEEQLLRAQLPDGGEGEPVGDYREAALRFQSGRVRATLGDHEGAVTDLRASLDSRPTGEHRARALTHAALAELLLQQRELEAACASWHEFLREGGQIRSGAARRAHARIGTLLRPFVREPCVRELFAAVPGLGTEPGSSPEERPHGADGLQGNHHNSIQP
ncbi:hypothetical protein [Streptomyces sp. NPDC005438]|uniref:hypothetical protein n=1 Tax=Streptomyces sp. NPDC005438 TaxID=3156880 RepID=UPI0033B81425